MRGGRPAAVDAALDALLAGKPEGHDFRIAAPPPGGGAPYERDRRLMDPASLIWIAPLMAVAAALYSSVGHGGASAYLAIMALFAVAPETMRPTALALNLVVAGFGALRYGLRGQTNYRLLLAFAVTAMPAAFIGGVDPSPARILPAAGRRPALARRRSACSGSRRRSPSARCTRPRCSSRLPVGAALGLLAGLTGTGGGIFLSPLIILFAWETPAAHVGRGGGLHLPQFGGRPARQSRLGARAAGGNADPGRARSRWGPCSAPGSASRNCRASGCCRRSAWCWSWPARS